MASTTSSASTSAAAAATGPRCTSAGCPTASTAAGDRFFVRYTNDHTTQRVLRRYRAGFYRAVLLAGSGLVCLAHQPEPVLSATIRELRRSYDPKVPVMRDPAVPLPDDEPALRALQLVRRLGARIEAGLAAVAAAPATPAAPTAGAAQRGD